MSLKGYLTDFPTQTATVMSALLAFLALAAVATVRLAWGKVFPEGYDSYIWAVLALGGVGGAYGVGKRLSDVGYKNAGQPSVNVGGPSTVTVSTTAETETPKLPTIP